MKTKVLTTFVKDSPIADFIKRNLRSSGIDYEGAEVEQGQVRGDTVISSTLPTADTAHEVREYATTERGKSEER